MEENSEEVAADYSSHPLMVSYHDWRATRCIGQTKTTLQAVSDAYLAGDVELLETYDRLLGPKDGAWIKHIVKTVRKNPDLGDVSTLTEKQLLAYADMRRAITAVLYGQKKKDAKERNWEQENDLQHFAVSYPEHVAAVTAVMVELKTMDLEIIHGLIAERSNAHSALVAGAL